MKNWWHKREITFPCTPSGSLDIKKLQCELEEKGRVWVRNSEGCNSRHSELANLPCQIINLKSFQPWFEYTPRMLKPHDLIDLLDDGYLCMMGAWLVLWGCGLLTPDN